MNIKYTTLISMLISASSILANKDRFELKGNDGVTLMVQANPARLKETKRLWRLVADVGPTGFEEFNVARHREEFASLLQQADLDATTVSVLSRKDDGEDDLEDGFNISLLHILARHNYPIELLDTFVRVAGSDKTEQLLQLGSESSLECGLSWGRDGRIDIEKLQKLFNLGARIDHPNFQIGYKIVLEDQTVSRESKLALVDFRRRNTV